jgi:Na+/pantothenate symporter
MMTMSAILVFVNGLFLMLGGVLYLYASANGITATGDDLFPTIALSDTFSAGIGIIFIIALISALFPSVDGAITSLTSSFCIDILDFKSRTEDEKWKRAKRLRVHITFALIFFAMVLMFKAINDKSIIQFIIKFAGITYGPLLGLFSFGILTKRILNDKLIPLVCIGGPLLTVVLDMLCNPAYYEKLLHVNLHLQDLSASIFNGYKIGPELILINGTITFLGLLLIAKKSNA